MAAGPRSAPPGMPRGALHAVITSPGMQRARWDSLHCACVPVTSLKRDEPLPVGAAAAGRRDAAVAGSRDLARARVPAAGARPALAPRPAAQPGDGAGAARAHRGAVGARRRDARLRGAGERRGRVWPRCSGQRAAPWQAAANSQSRGVFPERAAGGYSWVLPDSPCTCRPAPQYAARQGSPLRGSYPTAGFPRAPTGVRCRGDRS